MPTRIEIGTDIAMIGLWDPTLERHDLKSAKYATVLSELRSEAENSRLFLISTGADGGYLTDIYLDEQPDPKIATLYDSTEREFLIKSESGRLIAGGIEDFISSKKSITSDSDELSVHPGFYALRHCALNLTRFEEHVRNIVGNEDYDYLQRKSGGFPMGCLFAIIGIGCMMARLWQLSIGLFVLAAVCFSVRNRILKSDERYQKVDARIGELEPQFPPFIYVLRKVTETTDLKGGWFDLP